MKSVSELMPWRRGSSVAPGSFGEDRNPILTLHREMNRMFDDLFRGFDGQRPLSGFSAGAWPHIEVADTGNEVRVVAEVPGMEEKDMEVTIEDGMLTLRGERR